MDEGDDRGILSSRVTGAERWVKQRGAEGERCLTKVVIGIDLIECWGGHF